MDAICRRPDQTRHNGWDDLVIFPGWCAERGHPSAYISAAIAESPWIHDDEAASCLDRILHGDDDAVLCVLVPLLRRLRAFNGPHDSVSLFDIVGRIARSYTTTPAKQRSDLPLSQLVFAGFEATADDDGVTLDIVANFAALPSIRRIYAVCLRDYVFSGWPQSLPYSCVSEMYFARSTVTRNSVEIFAKGIKSPCIIRQQYEYNQNWDSDYEWDHYRISGEIDYDAGAIRVDKRWELAECKYSEDYYREVRWGEDISDANVSPGMRGQGNDDPRRWQDLAPLM